MSLSLMNCCSQRSMLRLSRCINHLSFGQHTTLPFVSSTRRTNNNRLSHLHSSHQLLVSNQCRSKHTNASSHTASTASKSNIAPSASSAHIASSSDPTDGSSSQHDVPDASRTLSIEYASNIPTSYNPLLAASGRPQDALLFTPGPLTTSFTVKSAMLTDLGSRDAKFINVIQDIQSELLDVARVRPDDYVVVPIQGSGTFGIESVLCSAVARTPKSPSSTSSGVLIVANGAYGLRQVAICKAHSIPYQLIEFPDSVRPTVEAVERALTTSARACSLVSMVHSETTSGIINDIQSIGQLAHKHAKSFIVDAMSSFGGVDSIDFDASHITYLISSSNKCIEGVPGFSFVIARRASLHAECVDNATSLSLDLASQHSQLLATKQFRFTPPTHTLVAFRQALRELRVEGGVTARQARYKRNQEVLLKGLSQLGFKLYLPPQVQGHIITSFHWPTDSNWDFATFYKSLSDRGFVIYPGKVSSADCFRIGHIGRIFESDTLILVQTIDQVCKQMKTAKYFTKSNVKQ